MLSAIELPHGNIAHFFSDLHLSDIHPELTHAFIHTLETLVQNAQNKQGHVYGMHVFLLGDVFEVWVGDDHHSATRKALSKALQKAKQKGVTLYFMQGNRDFLVGPSYCQEAGLIRLADPCTLTLQSAPNTPNTAPELRLILSHGDALCTDDTAYQAFRQQSRNPKWQTELLAKPLAVRLHLAQTIRQESTEHKQQTAASIMDTHPNAVATCFNPPGHIAALVHGHTHRSAVHHYHWSPNQQFIHENSLAFKPHLNANNKRALQGQLHPQSPVRIVLPDWHIVKQESKVGDKPTQPQPHLEHLHAGWLTLHSCGQWHLHHG